MKITTWRNKKSGGLYHIYDKAIDCTNERAGLRVIIYYLKSDGIQNFVCEESEFYEKFEKVPRLDGYCWDDAQRAMLCL